MYHPNCQKKQLNCKYPPPPLSFVRLHFNPIRIHRPKNTISVCQNNKTKKNEEKKNPKKKEEKHVLKWTQNNIFHILSIFRRLEQNSITEITPKAFSNFKRLRRIDLSNNNISRIAHDAFAGLKSLTTL